MPGFQENRIGIGPICDADYSVTFTKDAVSIYSPNGHRVLRGGDKRKVLDYGACPYSQKTRVHQIAPLMLNNQPLRCAVPTIYQA